VGTKAITVAKFGAISDDEGFASRFLVKTTNVTEIRLTSLYTASATRLSDVSIA
jgi:hypothetical protein